jgi:hypothetical protein
MPYSQCVWSCVRQQAISKTQTHFPSQFFNFDSNSFTTIRFVLLAVPFRFVAQRRMNGNVPVGGLLGPIRGVACKFNENSCFDKSELARSSSSSRLTRRLDSFIRGGPRNYAHQKKNQRPGGPHE